MTQATISVILKKDKNPTKCESYRPISLLTCDYKILTKILSLRLEQIIPKIVNADQTGFIKGRQSFHNVRRLFNIIYSKHSTQSAEYVISLDAHKAFDQIEYAYLFATLRKFGFGPVFVSWIETMYAKPQARVRTNNLNSAYFPLFRGTRQGCPLSPLLFDLAIEPLAAVLRANKNVQGIKRGGLEHKLSLYADDLLLFIKDPEASIPQCLDIISQFGKSSGYKIHFNKSVLFPINNLARLSTYNSHPFKLTRGPMLYLGVNVTSAYKDIFQHNFETLLGKIKEDLNRWATLPLSLAEQLIP